MPLQTCAVENFVNSSQINVIFIIVSRKSWSIPALIIIIIIHTCNVCKFPHHKHLYSVTTSTESEKMYYFWKTSVKSLALFNYINILTEKGTTKYNAKTKEAALSNDFLIWGSMLQRQLYLQVLTIHLRSLYIIVIKVSYYEKHSFIQAIIL